MKTKLINLLSLLFVIFFAQSCVSQQKISITEDEHTEKNTDEKTNTDSRTFQVCDVVRSNEPLKTEPYRDIIFKKLVKATNDRLKRKAIDKLNINWQEKAKLRRDPSYIPEGVSFQKLEATAKKDIQLVKTRFHPFVETLHKAYARHYPVTISPDMIWLLIAQGFANHVNENGEEMRDYFVDFEGKKDLLVKRNNFKKGSPNNDWQGVFAEFSVQIEENTGADLLELVTGDFSTTTAIEKAAFQVTLMDAMKSYFRYSAMTTCGIPEITLEGSVEDWKMIEAKAQELAQYDLQGWIDGLMPVLQEFTAAAEGKVDKDFWESIYKWNSVGSGNAYITGWVLKFFPYKKRNDGQLIPFAIKHNKNQTEEIDYRLTATTGEFTSGMSKADMLWDYHRVFYSMELMAGFVGFHQDPETLSLRPEISWAVIDKNEKPSKERIESYEKGGDEEYLNSKDKQ